MIDVEKSEIVSDYRKYKYLPTADELLDYRLVCMSELAKDVNEPIHDYLKQEIAGTDFLITLTNKI